MLKAPTSSYFAAPAAPPHQAAPESVQPRVRGVISPASEWLLQPRSTNAPLPPRSASALPTLPHDVLVRVAAQHANTGLAMLGVNSQWHAAAVESAAQATPTGRITTPAEFILAVHAVRAGHLKTIQIDGNFSADQLTTMMEALPDNLQGLELMRCHQLTDAQLNTALQDKPLLHTVNLRACRNLTDAGIQAALQDKPLLHTVDLSGCRNLTDAGIQAALQDKPLLHTVDLSWCLNLTDAGIQAALQDKPLLDTVGLRGCLNLTDAGIQAALQDKPLLDTVNLYECPNVSEALRTELRDRGITVVG
jgi:hypothetical protein